MLSSLLLALALSSSSEPAIAAPVTTVPASVVHPPISVATFNIWVGGQNAVAGNKPESRRQTLAAMQALDADILCIQEQKALAADYAAKLGSQFIVLGDSTAILTRFEIVEPSPRTWGVKLRTPGGLELWVFNVHFPAAPYQPYQLESIPYHDARFITTPAEARTEARLARGEPAHRCLKDMEAALADKASLVILCGDFNEPSCLDWTAAATTAWKRTGPIDWPTTRLFHDAGFVDAFREVHPDPVTKPGWTWTPRPDARDVMDRIDLVLVRPPAANTGSGAWRVTRAQVAGESGSMTDLVVEPWPSDHRAVRAVLEPSPR